MVIMAGQLSIDEFERGSFHETPHTELVKPITKWCAMVYQTSRIAEYIDMAFRKAARGLPGPTFIDLPRNILEEEIDDDLTVLGPAPKLAGPQGTRPWSPGPWTCLRKPKSRWWSTAAASSGAMLTGNFCNCRNRRHSSRSDAFGQRLCSGRSPAVMLRCSLPRHGRIGCGAVHRRPAQFYSGLRSSSSFQPRGQSDPVDIVADEMGGTGK